MGSSRQACAKGLRATSLVKNAQARMATVSTILSTCIYTHLYPLIGCTRREMRIRCHNITADVCMCLSRLTSHVVCRHVIRNGNYSWAKSSLSYNTNDVVASGFVSNAN